MHEYTSRNAGRGFASWLQCLEGVITVGMTSAWGVFNWKYVRRGVLHLEIPAEKINPYRPVPPFTANVRQSTPHCRNTIKTNVFLVPPRTAIYRQSTPRPAKVRHPNDVYRQNASSHQRVLPKPVIPLVGFPDGLDVDKSRCCSIRFWGRAAAMSHH